MDAVELLSHERTGGLMQELQSAVEEHVAEEEGDLVVRLRDRLQGRPLT